MVKDTEYYDILEVDVNASENDIKRSYRRLALKYHPDKCPDDAEAAEKFKNLGAAYETLSDPEKRSKYDKYGKDHENQASGSNPFETFMAQFGGRHPPNEDLVTSIAVTLEEFYNGKLRKVAVTSDRRCRDCNENGWKKGARPATCSICNGAGSVIKIQQIFAGLAQRIVAECSACKGKGKTVRPSDLCDSCKGRRLVKQRKVLEIFIEKGMSDGTTIRFAGEGDESLHSETASDVVIHLKEVEHSTFRRAGNHLIMDKTISLAEALCGLRIPVTHLDSRTIVLQTQPGQVLDPNFAWVVHREGMPLPNTGGVERGKLIVNFEVVFPKSIPLQVVNNYLAPAFEARVAMPRLNGQQVQLKDLKKKQKRHSARQVEGRGQHFMHQAMFGAMGGGVAFEAFHATSGEQCQPQ